MRELIIGLDIGSSSTKGVVVKSSGELLASASRKHDTSQPHPGWQEQDPVGSWWRECVEIVRELLAAAAAKPEEAIRIGVTGLVPGMCLLDSKGEPLRPAILHTDTRADEEMARIHRHFPAVHHGHLVSKLAWVRNHEPVVFNSTFSALVPHSFIVYKLTGAICCDQDTATIYGALYDEDRLDWDESACAELGVPLRMLPPTYPAPHRIGSLSGDAAELLGLTTATEVIVGTGDSFATLLGAGVRDAHELMLYWGSSGTRLYTRSSPANYLDGPFFDPGKAEFVGSIFSCGESLDHMRMLMGNHPWRQMDFMAETAPPGAGNLFFIPHLKQQSSADSPAAADHVIGLKGSHTSGHLYRAILEGIAYTTVLELGSLARVDRVRVCGGAASCSLLRAILATLLGMPVHYNPEASTALGIAFLAALSDKGGGDFAALSRNWFEGSHNAKAVLQEPKPEWAHFYEDGVGAFASLRKGLLALPGLGK